MQKIFNYLLFYLIVFLKWPIFIFIGLLNIFKLIKINYLFLVYPGSETDIQNYTPLFMAKTFILSGRPTLVGFIFNKTCGNGLVLAIPNTIGELRLNKKINEKIICRLKFIAKITGAKTIALAGQLSGVMAGHKIELNKPFVSGAIGTVFSVADTLDQVIKKHQLNLKKINIVLVGVGYVGGLLLNFLKDQGYKIIGIDIKVKQKNVVLLNQGEKFLKKADLVIVLTPRGEDFLPYIKHLKKNVFIIDDTHPKIKEIIPNAIFYKVAAGLEKIKFFPKLPGYKNDWIPGCVLEAMVIASNNQANQGSQSDFNQTAKKLGFFGRLVN